MADTVVHIFGVTSGIIVGIIILAILALSFSRNIRKRSTALQLQFSANLSAREKSAEARRAVSRGFTNSLLDYDVHLADFRLESNSRFCGRSLMQLDIRNRSGVSIVRIVRGGININIPGGRTILYPGDQIVVAVSDQEIDRFKQMLDGSLRPADEQQTRAHVTLERFTIEPEHRLVGISIIDSHIREQAQCIVMGIERGEQLITNPDPHIQFQESDIVIVAGETERIKDFINP